MSNYFWLLALFFLTGSEIKGTDSIDYAWFIWSDIKDLHGLKWIR